MNQVKIQKNAPKILRETAIPIYIPKEDINIYDHDDKTYVIYSNGDTTNIIDKTINEYIKLSEQINDLINHNEKLANMYIGLKIYSIDNVRQIKIDIDKNYNEEITKLKNKSQSLNAKLITLREENDILKKENDILKISVEELKKSVDDLRKINESLTIEKSISEKTIKDLKLLNENLDKQNKELNERNNELTEQHKELNKNYKETLKSMEDLQNRIKLADETFEDTIKTMTEEFNETIEAARIEKENSQQRAKLLAIENNISQEKIDRLTQENLILEEKFNEYKSSMDIIQLTNLIKLELVKNLNKYSKDDGLNYLIKQISKTDPDFKANMLKIFDEHCPNDTSQNKIYSLGKKLKKVKDHRDNLGHSKYLDNNDPIEYIKQFRNENKDLLFKLKNEHNKLINDVEKNKLFEKIDRVENFLMFLDVIETMLNYSNANKI